MRKIEIALLLLALAGFALLYQHIAGGSALLTFSCLLLSFLYTMLGTFLFNDIGFRAMFRKPSYAGLGAGQVISCVFAGILLGTGVLGSLFGILQWEGVAVMMFNSLLLLSIAGLLFLVLYIVKPARYKLNVLVRAAFLIIIWLAVRFLS